MRPAIATAATVLLLALAAVTPARAQQIPDSSFAPVLGTPAFAAGKGPLVLIDEGHHNFHTLGERFLAFGRLARQDGFVVRPARGKISRGSLGGAKVLVIANAIAERNVDDWVLPTPSAFEPKEIAAIRAWVEAGGALLLIADHMPFPGAIANLAAEFGFLFGNGYALRDEDQGNFTLTRARGELLSQTITDNEGDTYRIDSLHVFTGSAFRTVVPVETLLVLGPGVDLVMPEAAWQFSSLTPRLSAHGMLQGAIRRVGKGRVAVFAEAAMFTAQLAGPQRAPMGMNAPIAPQNARFARNVLRWLAGVMP